MIFLRRSNKYFANSEKSNTFAILNQKVYLQCLFQTWLQRTLPYGKPNAHRQPKQRKRPDGGIGRRAGLKHQWSNPCRFDPGSGYKMQVLDNQTLAFFFFPFCTTVAPPKRLFWGKIDIFLHPVHKNRHFHGQTHHFELFVHKKPPFYG